MLTLVLLYAGLVAIGEWYEEPEDWRGPHFLFMGIFILICNAILTTWWVRDYLRAKKEKKVDN
jgi:hypothetical protein